MGRKTNKQRANTQNSRKHWNLTRRLKSDELLVQMINTPPDSSFLSLRTISSPRIHRETPKRISSYKKKLDYTDLEEIVVTPTGKSHLTPVAKNPFTPTDNLIWKTPEQIVNRQDICKEYLFSDRRTCSEG